MEKEMTLGDIQSGSEREKNLIDNLKKYNEYLKKVNNL